MIAIQSGDGSWADRWSRYCSDRGIDYIRADIYDNDLITLLRRNDVNIFLAQPLLYDYRTNLIARSVLHSLSLAGISVFPNNESFWHYDDKISQKYIFEALEIPHAPMHVFYNKKQAAVWLENAQYPLVFKLRGGASSSNVRLLRDFKAAKRQLARMFGPGIKAEPSAFTDLGTKIRDHKKHRDWSRTLKNLPATLRHIISLNRNMPRQKGYFLVQDFMPGNDHDTRVFVMGKKAIAARRFVRPGDFRASGSHNADPNQDNIDRRAIELAFRTSSKIGSSSMAYDIIKDSNGDPVIVEMSYSMPTHIPDITEIEGFWDDSLVLHRQKVRCEDIIISNLLGI